MIRFESSQSNVTDFWLWSSNDSDVILFDLNGSQPDILSEDRAAEFELLLNEIQFCEDGRDFGLVGGKSKFVDREERCWISDSLTSKCEAFRWEYGGCASTGYFLNNVAEYNEHVLEYHWHNYIREGKPLQKIIVFDSKKKNRVVMTKCGSCLIYYPVNSIKHLTGYDCQFRPIVFETMEREMLHEWLEWKYVLDDRFVSFRDGYFRFLNIVKNGAYNSRVKEHLIINRKMFECEGQVSRFYIIASKNHKFAYLPV